jgi:hypothetical protein
MHNLSSTTSNNSNNRAIANVSRIGVGSNYGGFWMTPIFASGQVLVSSLLDNVLFQAYSKTHILDLIKLCCGVRFKQAIELDQMLGIDCSNICLIDAPVEYIVRVLYLFSKSRIVVFYFSKHVKIVFITLTASAFAKRRFVSIGEIIFEAVPGTGVVVRDHPLGLVPSARPRVEQRHAICL